MVSENPLEKKKIYDEDFRRRYIFTMFVNPDTQTPESTKYEETYFSNKDEFAKLRRTEIILICEYLLGVLPEIKSESIKHLITHPAMKDVMEEAKTLVALPEEELKKKLEELKKLNS